MELIEKYLNDNSNNLNKNQLLENYVQEIRSNPSKVTNLYLQETFYAHIKGM